MRVTRFLDKVSLIHLNKKLKRINLLKEKMKRYSDADLQKQTAIFRQRLKNGATLEDILPEAFATVRELVYRKKGIFAYDSQILGAIVLHQGQIAEMKTGEGKTLTAIFPLYLNALTGKGAILVTTNTYLARRDAEEMSVIFEALDLSVGVGVFEDDQEVTIEEQRRVYDSDIVYTTAATLGFNYLSNNLVTSKDEKFMRDFHYVIIDEIDAVLLDSAQTPLIISGSPRVQSNLYHSANQFVEGLSDDEYFYDAKERIVHLTGEGIDYAEVYFDIDNLYDDAYFELNRHINLALRAHYLYKNNRDYLVEDNEVKLLDMRTGRVLDGTRLQSGLHQALETKEKVRLSRDSKSMASITYQSLFNLFPKLSGMSATAKIAEDELIETYKLAVVSIPTHKATIRKDYPNRIFKTLPEKLVAILDLVKECHKKEQPILLVSGTVEGAEIYSKLLLQEGIAHNLLTANNLVKEAQIIKEAGQRGAVTVATPLAGRGTDIRLGEGVAELGGLVVIGTEPMENSRVQEQLRGRSGRQGDPGMSLFFASLEDEIVINHGPEWVKSHLKEDKKARGQLTSPRFKHVIKQALIKSEDIAKESRRHTIQFEESLRIQRKYIYNLRDALIFEQIAMTEMMDSIFRESIINYVMQNPHPSSLDLRRYILENYSYQFKEKKENTRSTKEISELLWHLYQTEIERKKNLLGNQEQCEKFYRSAVLRAIDSCWIEQVDYLQQLKYMVLTRQIGQRSGLNEYYQESLISYQDLSLLVKDKIVKNIMLSRVKCQKDGKVSVYFV